MLCACAPESDLCPLSVLSPLWKLNVLVTFGKYSACEIVRMSARGPTEEFGRSCDPAPLLMESEQSGAGRDWTP